MGLLEIPNELLLIIAENIDNPADLSALCQINRRLAYMFTPTLHHLAIHNIDYGVVALHWSAAIGNEPLVRLIMENSQGINILDLEYSRIYQATTKPNDQAISAVMSKGARIIVFQDSSVHPSMQLWDRSSICLMIHRHRDDLLARLFDMGAGEYNDQDISCHSTKPFHYAVRFGSVNTVRLFIEYGADIEARDDIGSSPLNTAVCLGRKEVIKLLIEAGADVNFQDEDDDNTILHLAVSEKDIGLVKLLLKNGADRSIPVQNSSGDTPLGLLLDDEDESPLMLLLLRNADNTFVWEGCTALHIAAEKGFKGMIGQLLENGIDIDEVDSEGRTALHLAAFNGNNTIAKFLVDQGASIDSMDYISGDTPLDLAKEVGNNDMVDYIRRFSNMEDRAFENIMEGHSRKFKKY